MWILVIIGGVVVRDMVGLVVVVVGFGVFGIFGVVMVYVVFNCKV